MTKEEILKALKQMTVDIREKTDKRRKLAYELQDHPHGHWYSGAEAVGMKTVNDLEKLLKKACKKPNKL